MVGFTTLLDLFCKNNFMKICAILISPLLNIINPIFIIIYFVLVMIFYYAIKEPKYIIHYTNKEKKEKNFGKTMLFTLYIHIILSMILTTIGVFTGCKINYVTSGDIVYDKIEEKLSNENTDNNTNEEDDDDNDDNDDN